MKHFGAKCLAAIANSELLRPLHKFTCRVQRGNIRGAAVSDNVFVATVFVEELEKVFVVNGTFIGEDAAAQAATKLQYDRLGTAIIAGTNLPSMFTPNGQAALLFILTSSIAPLVHLSYRKMMVMTLPYVLVCASTGALAVCFWQWDM